MAFGLPHCPGCKAALTYPQPACPNCKTVINWEANPPNYRYGNATWYNKLTAKQQLILVCTLLLPLLAGVGAFEYVQHQLLFSISYFSDSNQWLRCGIANEHAVPAYDVKAVAKFQGESFPGMFSYVGVSEDTNGSESRIAYFEGLTKVIVVFPGVPGGAKPESIEVTAKGLPAKTVLN